MIKISKDFEFCAAHHLPNYKGDCANLHGHTWMVRVTFEGTLNKTTGMVEDFKLLKAMVEPIIGVLDHSYLNDRITNPTAENIALYIYHTIEEDLNLLTNPTVKLEGVKVWESPTSFVTIKHGR